jgi:hypothetical protein
MTVNDGESDDVDEGIIQLEDIEPLPEDFPLATGENFYPAGRRPIGILRQNGVNSLYFG